MTEHREQAERAGVPAIARFALRIQIGTMAGIPIQFMTFILILVWFGLGAAAAEPERPTELVYVLAVFGCVV
jgi:hypothetical protein